MAKKVNDAVYVRKLDSNNEPKQLGGASENTAGLIIPSGTTAQRPTPGAGEIYLRFNTTTGKLEIYDGTSWKAVH